MELECTGISRNFLRGRGESNVFTAVNRTDFVLEEGSLTEIIGRSGSGKTTFINMLAGLVTPSSGKVMLDGHDLYSLSDKESGQLRNSCIGMIPQGNSALNALTVLENILVPVRMYDRPLTEREYKERALKLMTRLGINELADVFPSELSGGELRRMAIVRALIGDPLIIIADEPTGDLDDRATEEVMTLLREQKERGASLLVVTHDKDVKVYADRVFRMDGGTLTPLE